MIKVLFTKGNHKLPKTTYILNTGSATDCPSRKLGLCQCPDKCYAMKAEKQYPAVLSFRRKQREVFTLLSAEELADSLLNSSRRARVYKMESFRFSEAGDFENQKDVEKMALLCKILTSNGVQCYGYTARTDLDLAPLIGASTVNVSNDFGRWAEKGANRFQAVEEYSSGSNHCMMNCAICHKCATCKGRTIEVKIH